MTQVVRISKQGKNVLGTAATDPNNLIFDSQYNTFKIITSGTLLGTVNSSSTGTITIAHGLGYVPFVDGFAKRTALGGVVGVGGTIPFPTAFQFTSAYANSGTLFFTIKNDYFSSAEYAIRYYCYEVPIE